MSTRSNHPLSRIEYQVMWNRLLSVVEEQARALGFWHDEHPQDKRSRTIDVTEEGYRVIEAVKPILAQVRRETLALVDNSQLQLATDLLDAVLAGATRAAGADGRG